MTTQLPSPKTLKEAVQAVIEQNQSVGYRPGYFISATQEGYADNLIQVCTNLIYSDTAVEALQSAVSRYSIVITLEDFIVRSEHGRGWGFDEESVRQAEATVQLLDQQFGCQRWR